MDNVKIWDNCIISPEVTIGKYSSIGACSHILGNVKIGENVNIQSFAFIPSGTIIGDNVFIGPRVTILNDKYPPSKGKYWLPVFIDNGVVIGGNVTILPGVTIGKNSIIGAGSIITRDVPANVTVFGNPAKIYKK